MTAFTEITTDVDTLHAATDAAAQIMTAPPRRAAALTYLRQRGIDAGNLPDEWTLGYAPPGWTRLTDSLRGQFCDQALVDAGLATRSSRGTLIDVFRDRVIFPIYATDGRTAGFIGRDLSGAPSAPKYLNTRQSPIFTKGTLLYGFHEAKSLAQHVPVVVEGPLDVLAIAAHPEAAGRDLAPVAASGTAFTLIHARRVAELATGPSSAIVAMDGDAAGRSACTTAGEFLRYAGLSVRVAAMPTGVDPADHLTQPGATLEFLDDRNTLPLLTVHVERAIAAQGDRIQWIEGRLTAARAITSYLSTYPPSYSAGQITWISNALDLSTDTVTTELVHAYRVTGQTTLEPSASVLSPARDFSQVAIGI